MFPLTGTQFFTSQQSGRSDVTQILPLKLLLFPFVSWIGRKGEAGFSGTGFLVSVQIIEGSVCLVLTLSQ